MEEHTSVDKSWKRVLMIVVDPLTFIIRMTTHIAILSAKERDVFLKNLLIVSILFEAVGVIDLVFYHRWPLVVAQIPIILYVLRTKDRVSSAIERDAAVDKVEIDTKQVEELSMTIYDELDKIAAEEVKPVTKLEGLVAGATESSPSILTRPQINAGAAISPEQMSNILSKLEEREKVRQGAEPEPKYDIFGI